MGLGRLQTTQAKEDTLVTAEEIEDKVFGIVSEQMAINKAEITRETAFINDLNADSLDIVELVMEFEDNFDMSIPDEEAEKIKTIGHAIDYIAANHSEN
jgi:acyl carrier protein